MQICMAPKCRSFRAAGSCNDVCLTVTIESAESDAAAPSWIWLVDVERACTLLIGRCLGGMLLGIPLSPEEIKCNSWMNSALFSSGSELLTCDIGTVVHVIRLF